MYKTHTYTPTVWGKKGSLGLSVGFLKNVPHATPVLKLLGHCDPNLQSDRGAELHHLLHLHIVVFGLFALIPSNAGLIFFYSHPLLHVCK